MSGKFPPSTIRTDNPFSRRGKAEETPAGPEPTMMTSNLIVKNYFLKAEYSLKGQLNKPQLIRAIISKSPAIKRPYKLRIKSFC